MGKGVTDKDPSLLSFLLHKESSVLGASLCDMTDLARGVALAFCFQLLPQLWRVSFGSIS